LRKHQRSQRRRARYTVANLTVAEVFALFRRSTSDIRWLDSADSQEYLALVAYLVARQPPRDQAAA
jgi:hypothetical protein